MRRPRQSLLNIAASSLISFGLVCTGVAQEQSVGRDGNRDVPVASKFATVFTFNGSNGSDLESPLVQGTDGNLYGTTFEGGAYSNEGFCSAGCGTMFKLTTRGDLTTIYSFCAEQSCADGWGPWGLTLATDGNFYDTTFGAAGQTLGTIFKITPAGARKQLFAFEEFAGCKQLPECYGIDPMAGLVEASDQNFYATAVDGGTGGGGVVLKVNPQEPLPPTVLYDFTFPTVSPAAALIQGNDSALYGTTYDTALFDQYTGSVFRLSLTGQFSVLYNFCSKANCADGSRPYDPVVQAANGNFYGTTSTGGFSLGGSGTVFEVTPTGVMTTLHVFGTQSPDGGYPVGGLVQATDGNLYGVTPQGGTYGSGVIFMVTMAGAYKIVHSFRSTEGSSPDGGLMQATNGLLYGTTSGGKTSACSGTGCGTVFSLDLGLDPFVAFVLPLGKVGDTVQILGQGLSGTTNVTFNGVKAASFDVVSDTYLTAVVPPGTTTGRVVVTTPKGVLKSNKNFNISQ